MCYLLLQTPHFTISMLRIIYQPIANTYYMYIILINVIVSLLLNTSSFNLKCNA